MSAIKDLRELVNVSRLTFRDDDDDEDEEDEKVVVERLSSNKSAAAAKKQPMMSKCEPTKKKSNKTNNQQQPFLLSSRNLDTARSSLVLTDRSALLDRNVVPDYVSLTPRRDDERKTSADKEKKKLNKNIEPLKDPSLSNSSISSSSGSSNQVLSGNFDHMLAYIDASVVSDWLNRANRYLKKLSKWHRGPSSMQPMLNKDDDETSELRFEPFVKFCSFWIGTMWPLRFGERQRRELVEMEYSIVHDEVVHAFQCGIDSGQVSIGDVHALLRAVFREYPLQLLSFRGTYLVLDYVETLGSERQDDYKRLLSDVKCRTVNKQYAQWLLSIRSQSSYNFFTYLIHINKIFLKLTYFTFLLFKTYSYFSHVLTFRCHFLVDIVKRYAIF